MAGIKITVKDPADETKVIHAEFATARSHPEMLQKIEAIAMADVAEAHAARLQQIAESTLLKAEDRQAADEALEAMKDATAALQEKSNAVYAAIREFVTAGLRLAGADAEMAEVLAGAIPMDYLAELKSKCLYGAGAIDFTAGSDLQQTE